VQGRAEGALECGSNAAALQAEILQKNKLQSGSVAAALQKLRLLRNKMRRTSVKFP
jgi:hypothetical protein